MTSSPLAARLADLAVDLGANVQPGQIVTVSAEIGLEEFTREIVVRAYQRGAKFVDVTYYDPQVKRARIEHAGGDTLEFVPSWYGERVRELGRSHCARVVVAAPSDPNALQGLDPERLGRDQLPALPEWMEVLSDRTVNWTIVPAPTETCCHDPANARRLAAADSTRKADELPNSPPAEKPCTSRAISRISGASSPTWA